jgi:adenylate kinase
MLNLVLFGPPGAGKGTQAKLLAQTFNLEHVSTGELLRKEIAANTEIGIIAAQLIDKGEFAPDYIVIEMIKERLNSARSTVGFIFDGFPRNVNQAKKLDELLTENKSKVSVMLGLVVEKNQLVERLLKRGLESGRCDDMTAETIEHRIDIYDHVTAPIINYYEEQGKYHPISGMGTIKEIGEDLIAMVKKIT